MNISVTVLRVNNQVAGTETAQRSPFPAILPFSPVKPTDHDDFPVPQSHREHRVRGKGILLVFPGEVGRIQRQIVTPQVALQLNNLFAEPGFVREVFMTKPSDSRERRGEGGFAPAAEWGRDSMKKRSGASMPPTRNYCRGLFRKSSQSCTVWMRTSSYRGPEPKNADIRATSYFVPVEGCTGTIFCGTSDSAHTARGGALTILGSIAGLAGLVFIA